MMPPVNCRQVYKTAFTVKKDGYEAIKDVIYTPGHHFNKSVIALMPYKLSIGTSNINICNKQVTDDLLQSSASYAIKFRHNKTKVVNDTISGLTIKQREKVPERLDLEDYKMLLFVFNMKSHKDEQDDDSVLLEAVS